ncbi:DUF1707 SHOCT-like domain-containing protein [Streptomyces mirabilis]|uniref:DUF1707 SHOCT-like domain-containing protein n=1 Tax=Streptomyces mirabilis TaxID=68239 RepID=UPI00369E53D7
MNDSEEHITSPAIRASDAERDRVEARLQHRYAVGRLTLPELEERVVVAYEARTVEQLHALLRDLPSEVEKPASPPHAIDSRLLIVLLCVSPLRRSSTGSSPNARYVEGTHGRRPWKVLMNMEAFADRFRMRPSGAPRLSPLKQW